MQYPPQINNSAQKQKITFKEGKEPIKVSHLHLREIPVWFDEDRNITTRANKQIKQQDQTQ